MHRNVERMKCATCPVEGRVCLGESVPRMCELSRTRTDYRRLLVRIEIPTRAEPSTLLDLDAALARVRACTQRGPTLAASLQPSCGCGERNACGAGRGRPAGQVTLRDCLECIYQNEAEE